MKYKEKEDFRRFVMDNRPAGLDGAIRRHVQEAIRSASPEAVLKLHEQINKVKK